ncbi:MAG: hypothetical protein Greene041619_905 [Candidatus Peregrinibacteria bacterium Greene0416_19]|nr:MAG: hypothetical protein Greene041619_905 [Candidatus Peregrinibacteria bacterium Greene0416_19]
MPFTRVVHLQHEIFLVDADLEHPLDATAPELQIRTLVNDLLRTLGMFELGALQIYPATDQRAPGWSFVQPITTSHIASHYFERPGKHPHFHMDIYSCKSFDWRKVMEVLSRHRRLGAWKGNFIRRNMKSDKREVWEVTGRGQDVTEVLLLNPALAVPPLRTSADRMNVVGA